MKRVFFIIFILALLILPVRAEVLTVGVSIEDVPDALFGSWRVVAKLDETNAYHTFKPQSVDIWNLSRAGDILTLNNPFTGAKADISIKAVEGNLIVFSKKAPYDNKILTDTVSIRLDNGKFSGINALTLESYSLIDNHLMKTETARYLIKGEKISGENVLKQ
ncbi:hypothetical protein IJ750_05890 [bacterium]|nr:hypothetical protein [bacterium]